MLRRNFLKSIAALVASPALLLKKRKREADRQAVPMAMDFSNVEFPPDVFEAIKGIETAFDKQVGLSDVILYGKNKV